MLSDLVLLFSLSAELHQAYEKDHAGLSKVFQANPNGATDELRILMGRSEYWVTPVPVGTSPPAPVGTSPPAPSALVRVPVADTLTSDKLTEVLYLLRNGYAHFHWGFDN